MVKEAYYLKVRSDVLDAIPQDVTSILSVGCAGGETELVLKRRGKIVYGIEKEPAFRLKLESVLDRVIIADLDHDALDLPRDFFDCILLADVLEHVQHPAELLRTLMQSLKPGKYFIVSVPNIGHVSVVKNLLLGKWDYTAAGIMDETHVRFFTLTSLRKLFSLLELEPLAIRRKFVPMLYENARGQQQKKIYFRLNRLFASNRNPLLHVPRLRELFVYQYLFVLKKQ
jgi:2-polyprenyl-3-methyl-5-hydroxy-6-metoxy-1,4-benzoquinol methylase